MTDPPWLAAATEAAARQLLSDRTNGLCELDKICTECDCLRDPSDKDGWAYDRLHAADAIRAALPAIREGLAAEFAATFEVGTGEACELLGITYRQLDHGSRTGDFPCSHYPGGAGAGKDRYYTLTDLLAIQREIVRRQIAEELWPGLAKRRVG